LPFHPLRESSNEEDSSRSTGISGRNPGLAYDEFQNEGTKTSIVTWIIAAFIILLIGISAIYLFMFKFNKYKKEDIIVWVEHSRNLMSEGKKIDDAIKEMKDYKLPEDFIKKIVKKLK